MLNLVSASGTTAGTAPADHRSLVDHGRRIHNDATTLATEIRDTAADIEHYLADQVERRPYRTLGVAAGVGYVLGGGLRSHMTAILLNTAARATVALVAREVGARLAAPPSATPPSSNPSDLTSGKQQERS